MQLINRELSWLSFNERVLQEAQDPSVPLLERIRFLGIYSNNLDEFFRVRVATVHRMIELGDKKVEGYDGTPDQLLDDLKKMVVRLQRKFEVTYVRLLDQLEEHGLYHITEKDLNDQDQEYCRKLFEEEVSSSIVPILLRKGGKFPNLHDKSIYLAVKLVGEAKAKDRYAIVELPPDQARFHLIPGPDDPREKPTKKVLLLDDLIRANLASIFKLFVFEKVEAYTFKVTRDAELDLDDDLTASLLEKMERSLQQRKSGDPVRFLYDESMPQDMLEMLLGGLNLSPGEHVIPGGRYHNLRDFMKFPSGEMQELLYPPLPPCTHPLLEGKKSIIKEVLKKDVLLSYPYQDFDYLVDLLREAAIDPKVKSIRINLYRVATNSKVINALVIAAQNGKRVTAIVELLARFDEENNILVANQLKESGVNIIFGVPGMKVHSKLILITRMVAKQEQLIAHVGTGNFHEGTATLYADHGLITANPGITEEVRKVFKLFKNHLERRTFRHLLVSPFNTRRKFLKLIDEEIASVNAGGEGFILLKMNNLVDERLIRKLYQAADAGVKVKLIIRGICALVPEANQAGHIEAISIVDRFLEHSRIFVFGNNGDKKVFIGSGDWMGRNLDNRIEVACPIYDPEIQKLLLDLLTIQLNDNTKARIIDQFSENKYVKQKKGKPHRSQYEIYSYFKGLQ